MSLSVSWLRVRGLQRMCEMWRGSTILLPSQARNVGAKRCITSRPCGVSGMSLRPVCCPEMDHSVSP